MVRKIVCLVTSICLSLAIFAQAQAKEFFEKGNTAYQQNNYHEAIEHYKKAIQESKEPNAAVHFNLGNAFFKTQQLGLCILHYEKALKINPEYDKAQYNLDIANARIIDKVDVSPSAAFYSKWNAFLSSVGADSFAILALLVLLISAGGFYIFITGKSVTARKTGFATCIALLVLFTLSTYLSYAALEVGLGGNEAIVITKKVDVKTEPRDGSNTAFVLHEGAKVGLVSSMDNWKEISLENGNMGWIKLSEIQEI